MPLSTILMYHNIGYHVYADDSQLYISFKCKQPLEAIFSKLNGCLADIRRWMITNKLKINDSKMNLLCLDLYNWNVIWVGCQSMFAKVWLHKHQRWDIWESYSTNFSTLMIILLLYVEAHIFILETQTKLGIYNHMMLVLLLFMHLLVVDYIIVILFCTMFQWVKRIDYKDFRINVRASWKIIT